MNKYYHFEEKYMYILGIIIEENMNANNTIKRLSVSRL